MKKQTPERMFNRALFYLQRFSATEQHLATVLARQLQNKARKGEEEIPPDAATWIPTVVAKCVALGLVNDKNFAESRLVTLRRQGRSRSYIMQHMQQKGVPKALVAQLLADETDNNEETEEVAARRFVERRRLTGDPDTLQKDLGKLLRAGFSYQVAKRALSDIE